MKKTILLLILALFCFREAEALAKKESKENSTRSKDDSPVYDKCFFARFFSGPNFVQSTSIQRNTTTYDIGYILDGSAGFCWNEYGLCLEAEYAFRRNSIDRINFFVGTTSTDGYLQAHSVMANLIWDLVGCSFYTIQPFIGAGLGYDFQRMHATNSLFVFNQNWNDWAGQVMAGFAIPIFPNGEITLEYKFHQGGSHFTNHSVGVGLVYAFGFLR